MDLLLAQVPVPLLVLAASVACVAGIVKGLVGFAMPMILIAGLSSFLAPELALAALILPTLVTNVQQALAQGAAAAWRDAKAFRRFLIVSSVCLVLMAQVVPYLDAALFFVLLGVPVLVFSLAQLWGWTPPLHRYSRTRVETGAGVIAGTMGGLSGVWGPPTVMMLTAFGTEKAKQMRVQGVIYGLGAVLLVGSHLASGILTGAGLVLSVLMVVPAMLGMALGTLMQPRIDQAMFRRLTLIVLLVAAANLIRRGLMG
ncbi:TSUP family transporter [Pseudaestuariivita sp.]|uniref:TSUP family transporter n=1 Tax=Pseudaestuariivita sp. TaxID=2211669 RepID=UPI004057FE7F